MSETPPNTSQILIHLAHPYSSYSVSGFDLQSLQTLTHLFLKSILWW